MLELSLILPVHNEGDSILDTIHEIDSQLKRNGIKYEIICVENGSTDDSYRCLIEAQQKISHLEVYQSEKGWGLAVRKGIRKARGIFTCYMVSDGQVHPKYITDLLTEIKNYPNDLVKIARYTRENRTRFFVSYIYNALIRFLLGLKVSDVNGTPKLIKSNLINKIVFHSPNIAFDLELLLNLKNQGIRWREFSVKSVQRRSGKSSTKIATALEMTSSIIRFWLAEKLVKTDNR